jgi:thioredoxin-dependent peroxiredoxin
MDRRFVVGEHPGVELARQMKENSMAITEGKAAPAFTLPDQDGNSVALKDFKGRKVVVYFYPKDDTPGCTKEACGFRDHWQLLTDAGCTVLGISPDNASRHAAFRAKYNLPFPLLSDPDHSMMEKYGAWGEKLMYGKPVTGVIRSTVLIDEEGKVIRHWARVAKAEIHPAQVLEVIQALG